MRNLIDWLKSFFECEEITILRPEYPDMQSWSRYLHTNCCEHYAALQESCPLHPRENKVHKRIDSKPKVNVNF